MKLRLHENIKKLRKEKGLTQERLAEILDVSIGAVSKWESASNTPDIETIAILADFFDVSIDALLGYDISSKKIKDIVDQIYALSAAHKFDEAQTVSRDALIRYPHDFSIIYTSAFMLQITAFEKEDMKAARQAIKLYEDSKDHLSQNNDPNINEFTINLNIASCYAFFDEKKAIKIFKENNFAGISDAVMSFTYLKMGETEESLKCSTKGIIKNLFGLLNCASYMIIALTMRKNIKSTDSAFELCENSLTLIRMFKTKETGYLSKFEALFWVMKSYIHAISGNEDMMEACLKEGKRLARQYDKSSSNNIAEDLKFYYDKKETVIGYDSLGESAVEGIRKTINENIKKILQIDQGLADLILQKWDSL
ncbi:MAG: helix-turn-helix domain-containing protein [Lachnospiraceae bacterium]|nr:helix-turn-helix domain-containing protein [Lachnospiraceae bacterium]